MFKEAKEQMIDAQLRDMIADGSKASIDKVAQAASDVTRTQIREGSFANKILPPEMNDRGPDRHRRPRA